MIVIVISHIILYHSEYINPHLDPWQMPAGSLPWLDRGCSGSLAALVQVLLYVPVPFEFVEVDKAVAGNCMGKLELEIHGKDLKTGDILISMPF